MKKSLNRDYRIRKTDVATYVGLGVGSIIMLFPFIYALLGSMVSTRDFYDSLFLPWAHNDPFTLKNFTYAFQEELLQPILVTFARCIWYIAFNLFTSITCAYVFTCNKFKGKGIAFGIIMSQMLIPGIALMMPQYIFFARFPFVGGNDIFGNGGTGFINNPAVLFVGGLFSAYNIFMFRQAFISLGTELKEASQVDGANTMQIIFIIYTPLLRALVAVVIFNIVIGQWNDYLFPLMYIPNNVEWYPIGLKSVSIMNNFANSGNAGMGLVDYPVSFAVSIVMILPPLVAFVIMQKQFIEGLSMGSVKG